MSHTSVQRLVRASLLSIRTLPGGQARISAVELAELMARSTTPAAAAQTAA